MVSLSGDELTEYLSRCVAAAKSPYDLPVVSGLHLEIAQKNGSYHLESVAKITSSGPQSGGTDTSSANEGRESTADLHSGDTYTVGISSFPGRRNSPKRALTILLDRKAPCRMSGRCIS